MQIKNDALRLTDVGSPRGNSALFIRSIQEVVHVGKLCLDLVPAAVVAHFREYGHHGLTMRGRLLLGKSVDVVVVVVVAVVTVFVLVKMSRENRAGRVIGEGVDELGAFWERVTLHFEITCCVCREGAAVGDLSEQGS